VALILSHNSDTLPCIFSSGGRSNIRVGANPGGRKSPAGSRGGAPVGGLGNEVPQKPKAFRKICTKFGQNLAVL